MEGVRCLLCDQAFSTPSSALKLAERLSSWIPEHQDVVCAFEAKITHMLSGCLQASSRKAGREMMWSAYHALCISNEYMTEWNLFLALSDNAYSSIFCQYVGHYIFIEIIKKHHSKSEKPQPKLYSNIRRREWHQLCSWVGGESTGKNLRTHFVMICSSVSGIYWMMEMKVQASQRGGWR